MTLEESTARWIDLLAAQRAEHAARLHAFGRNVAFAALGLSAAIFAAVVLGLDTLWDVDFAGLELAGTMACTAAAAFVAACAFVALALHQQRRDRAAAIAHLDRAIPELLAGAEPRAVLGDLSERMRRLAPPRAEPGPSPYLPSLLDGRWLGTRAHTKVCLACALVVLASLLLASALVLAVPPDSDDEGDWGTPTASALHGVEALRVARGGGNM